MQEAFFLLNSTGEKIPLLNEVLEEYSNRLLINIELTNYSSPSDGLAQKVAAMIKHMGVEKSVLFSSFNPYNLILTRRIAAGCAGCFTGTSWKNRFDFSIKYNEVDKS